MTGAVEVVVPGSKSMTIRALAASALATGGSTIRNPLDSEDSRAASGVMRALGASIDSSSEVWAVSGVAGRPPPGDVVFDANESGLTARIGIALAAIRQGRTVITGRGRLPERPMSPLLTAIAPWGASARSSPGEWPIEIDGTGGRPRGGVLSVDVSLSTQPLSAILMVAPLGSDAITVRGHGRRGSWGYVELTAEVLRAFGAGITPVADGFVVEPTGLEAADYKIEPDASSAVYPFLAAAITGSRVTVPGLGATTLQPDYEVVTHLGSMGCLVDGDDFGSSVQGPKSGLQPIEADLSSCPDGAVAVAVACATADGVSRLSGLHSLRHKESDRVEALVAELGRVGASVEVEGDAVVISPAADLKGGAVDPHGDHRIAMAFGILSLAQPGITVGDPGVVAKTWPGYWEMVDVLRDSVV